MIKLKYNLKCARGHYHYSPTPEVFDGKGCGKPYVSPLTASGDIRRDAAKCHEVLSVLK